MVFGLVFSFLWKIVAFSSVSQTSNGKNHFCVFALELLLVIFEMQVTRARIV